METTKTIKEKTVILYARLNNATEEAEREDILNEIFFLNHPVILKWVQEAKNKMSLDFFLRVEKDLYQNLSTVLWECINNFDALKNASLFTYADLFLKNAYLKVIEDEIYQGAMTDHYRAAIRKASKVLESYNPNELSKQRIEEILLQNNLGKSTIANILPLIFQEKGVFSYINSTDITINAPISDFVAVEEDEIIESFLKTLNKTEKKCFELMEDLGRNKVFVELKKDGFLKKDIEILMSTVKKKAALFYIREYGKEPVINKEEKNMNMPPKDEKIDAMAKEIAIDAAVELGVENLIRSKVHKRIANLNVGEIEKIVSDELKNYE